MKKSLYQITEHHMEIESMLDASGGELTAEMEQLMTINENELKQKSLSYLEFIDDRESFIQRIDDEIKRLQQLKKTNKNIVDRLKSGLLNAVQMFGEFTTGTHKIGTRKSTSVHVENVDELPNEYKTVKITTTANKTDIKKALQNGVEIAGCELVETKNLKTS